MTTQYTVDLTRVIKFLNGDVVPKNRRREGYKGRRVSAIALAPYLLLLW